MSGAETEVLVLEESLKKMLDAAKALGTIGGGCCFCSSNRDPDKTDHEPECADLLDAIRDAEDLV